MFGAHVGLLLMTDVAVGRVADHVPDRWESMFLPDHLEAEVARFFGVKGVVLYERRGSDPTPDPGWGGRGWFVCFAVFLAMAVASAQRWGRGVRAALVLVAVPLGLFGLLLWALAAVSALPAVRWNELLLVFVPFDLGLAFLPIGRARRYSQIRVGLLSLVALLLAVGVLRQPLWAPLLIPFAPLALVAWGPWRASSPHGAGPTAPGTAPSEDAAIDAAPDEAGVAGPAPQEAAEPGPDR
jgi:hypothetical protein